LFKWLYVDIGSNRLNIHVEVREREEMVLKRRVSRATGNNKMMEFSYLGIRTIGREFKDANIFLKVHLKNPNVATCGKAGTLIQMLKLIVVCDGNNRISGNFLRRNSHEPKDAGVNTFITINDAGNVLMNTKYSTLVSTCRVLPERIIRLLQLFVCCQCRHRHIPLIQPSHIISLGK
jgi:hypothetical protein